MHIFRFILRSVYNLRQERPTQSRHTSGLFPLYRVRMPSTCTRRSARAAHSHQINTRKIQHTVDMFVVASRETCVTHPQQLDPSPTKKIYGWPIQEADPTTTRRYVEAASRPRLALHKKVSATSWPVVSKTCFDRYSSSQGRGTRAPPTLGADNFVSHVPRAHDADAVSFHNGRAHRCADIFCLTKW